MGNIVNSRELLYKKTGNDEAYTPKYGVLPILEFIPKHHIVWCPFDTEHSEFVKQISKTNKVEHSHISEGKDFFDYEPKKWDLIVSNPPFKNKRLFFEKALSFNKPFALLMTNTWLNDKYSKWVFKEAHKDMQLLMFDKRIHFEQQGKVSKKTTFSSSYFCCNFLPKQIILKEIHY
jgi:hypothetical protein